MVFLNVLDDFRLVFEFWVVCWHKENHTSINLLSLGSAPHVVPKHQATQVGSVLWSDAPRTETSNKTVVLEWFVDVFIPKTSKNCCYIGKTFVFLIFYGFWCRGHGGFMVTWLMFSGIDSVVV